MNKNETTVHKYWLTTILTEAHTLNDWQRDFLGNIRFHLDNGRPITDKQEASLEQLYEKVTR